MTQRTNCMPYSLVSYPRFQPDPVWLRQILLLADHIYRIVPKQITVRDTVELLEIQQHCGAPVKTYSTNLNLNPTPSELAMLNFALNQPCFKRIAKKGELSYPIGDKGRVSEPSEWENLHMAKIPTDVLRELERRNMIAESPRQQPWYLVPKGVGSLVVGMLANRIARQYGHDAVTDEPFPFAINTMSNTRYTDPAPQRGEVLMAIARAAIPGNIDTLPIKKYAQLRNSYADVRIQFASLVEQLRETHRLDNMTDAIQIRNKLAEISKDIRKDMKQYRKTRFAKRFRTWVPLSVGAIISAAFLVSCPPLAGGFATLGFGFALAAAGEFRKPDDPPNKKVLQLLCAADDAVPKTGIAAIRKLRQ